MRAWTSGLAAVCVLVALPAAAQTAAPQSGRDNRFFVTIGAGAQVSANTLDRDTTPTFYAEAGNVHQHFRMLAGPRVEFGGGLRFGRIEIGGALGVYRKSGTLDVMAGIPHPFFFNQFRAAGLSGPVHRSSLDLNIDVLLRLFRRRGMTFAIGAGPTYARLTQEIETALNLNDVYPYDTVVIQSFSTSSVKGAGVGGHVTGNVTYPLRRGLIANAVVRYSSVKASTPMETGATDVRWPVGGVQIVGGIRFLF